MNSSNLSAIRAVLHRKGLVLIEGDLEEFFTLPRGAIALSRGFDGNRLTAILESGFMMPALEVLEKRPAEVVHYISTEFSRDRNRPRRIAGLEARRGGVYVTTR
jgi:hypothetical protein